MIPDVSVKICSIDFMKIKIILHQNSFCRKIVRGIIEEKNRVYYIYIYIFVCLFIYLLTFFIS